MIKQVHIVPHTHWDKEWFFTASRAKVYLLKDLGDILHLLNENNEYRHFVLDGQASLLDDYLNWKPQDEELIKKLVESKKLAIGPWYSQTDQFLPSAESITRNLLYGLMLCQKLGGSMKVAYVPDSFGQESSMPQIYKEFGFKHACLWRGFSDSKVKHSEFVWKGEDGSKIKVYRMACGYFIGGLIDETRLSQIMDDPAFKDVVKQATTNQILFPQGSDMAPARLNLADLVRKMNVANKDYKFKISSLEEYVKAVDKQNPNLEVITGEQDWGKNMRVHKSIYSSRPDLKKLNTQVQNYLTNILEPVLCIGNQFGLEYPQNTVIDLWKKMFENAAHDSMGNCVSDQVNDTIYNRYKEVWDVSTSLVEITLRQISTRLNNKDNPITITVFNTLPVIRTEVIEKNLYLPSLNFKIEDETGKKMPVTILASNEVTQWVKGATIKLDPGKNIFTPDKVYKVKLAIQVSDVPAMGFKQLFVKPCSSEIKKIKTISSKIIENEYYSIEINSDGSLNILNKLNGKFYRRQAIIEENGDGGDSYNYSPATKDWVIKSTNQKHKVKIFKSELLKIIKINYDFMVPKDLKERASQIANTKLSITLTVKIKKNDNVIYYKVDIDNQLVNDHRLCINFDTGIASKLSIADIQFGSIKRVTQRNQELKEWHKNPEQWQEKPISINPVQSFVSLSNKCESFTLVPQGVREYEIVGEQHSIIRLTLMRTYGMLGKANLLYRPGRASGDDTVATPDAELHKKLTFSFGMNIQGNTFDDTDIPYIAKRINTPLQSYQYADFLNGRLIFPLNDVDRNLDISSYSFFKTKNNLTISTLKQAENEKGYILRLYNPYFKTLDDEVIFNKTPKQAYFVNLFEKRIEDIEIKEKKIQLKNIKHDKIVSIYFEY